MNSSVGGARCPPNILLEVFNRYHHICLIIISSPNNIFDHILYYIAITTIGRGPSLYAFEQMSCTPSNSLSRSLSPLSPSNESQFVPHPSLSSSVMEGHVSTSSNQSAAANVQEDETADGGKSNTTATTQDRNTNQQPDLVDADDDNEDDDAKNSIVGATICFTPEPSPRSSPNNNVGAFAGDPVPKLDLDTAATNSGSDTLQCGVPGGSNTNSKMSSSVMHVASSLDGRSTTEYELLDGISSKGTIEVEELILDEDDCDRTPPSLEDENKKKEGKSFTFNVAGDEVAASALLANPSSGATVESDAPLLMNMQSNQNSTDVPAFVSTAKLDALKLEDDITVTEDQTASPEVNDSPLKPFKNLHKFWEGKSNITHTTKSMIGRILGTDKKSKDNPDKDSSKSTEPVGTHADELGNSGQVTSKTKQLIGSLYVLACSTSRYVASILLTASLFIGMYIYPNISLVKATLERVLNKLLHKVKKRMISQDTTEVEKVLQDTVNKVAASAEATEQVTGTNLDKLFADEAMYEQDTPVGYKKLESSAALETKEKALLKRINDKLTTSVATKYKKGLSALKSSPALSSMLLAFICVFSMTSYMLQSNIGVNKNDLSIHVDIDHSIFDLHCVSTHSISYVGIPLWELLLAPSLFEDQVLDEVSSSWLSTFGSLFLVLSMLGAIKSKIPTKSDGVITGFWTEEEHQQFLAGFQAHGSRWKLVAEYVPTRTHTQVKAHGCYWVKIRSPMMMTKSRKSVTPIRTSFGSRTPISGLLTPRTPSSVSSSTSTPKKSNTVKVTPLRGILVEKNHSKYKNVSPRSVERTKKMKERKAQGSKSDPVKRVRIWGK